MENYFLLNLTDKKDLQINLYLKEVMNVNVNTNKLGIIINNKNIIQKNVEVFMEVIVGSIIKKQQKLLMVKESKRECYGKWSFPAGHLKQEENIFQGAQRETLEETGCKVELKKIFPIISYKAKNKNIIIIYFLADVIKENLDYNTDEILQTQWIDIDEIKNMGKLEFRSYATVNKIIENLEHEKFYNIDIIQHLEEFSKL